VDVQLLTSSGTRSMQVALHCWYDDYEDMAVLMAGIGCEHLLKAYLANHHPLLISDERDQALRFYAIGREDAAPVPLSHAKTISAEKAFRHVEALMKKSGMGVTWREFESMLIERNSVAHAAYCDKEKTAAALASAIAIADAIRTEFKISEEDFWGAYSVLRDDLVKRRNALRNARKYQDNLVLERRKRSSKTAARRNISPASIQSAADTSGAELPELIAITKVIYAKKIYEARWGKKAPSTIKKNDIARKGDIFDFEGWGESFPELAASGEPTTCPACGYPDGWTYGHVTARPCECHTPAKEDCVHYRGLRFLTRNRMFHCEACSLEAHDRDELIALGINVEIEEMWITPAPIRFEGREKR
jgi:hypothetical protein